MVLSGLDYVILAVCAFAVFVGLWRGLAGEIGAVAGMATVIGVLSFALPIAENIAAHIVTPDNPLTWRVATWAINGLMALVAAAIVRRLAARFLSLVIPQPFNALGGATIGIAKGLLLTALLAGVDYIETGCCAEGMVGDHSTLVKTLGTQFDNYASRTVTSEVQE